MKRQLFETIRVIPGGVGAVINRSGFLSAVLAINVSAGTDEELEVTVQHCDTEGGTFEDVKDSHIGVEGTLRKVIVSANDLANMDIDLIGCKEFIKITVTTSATATYALCLGDPAQAPA